VKIGRLRKVLGRMLPRAVVRHPFLMLVLVAVLIGGGLRFAPTSSASLPGTSGNASGASTACTAS